MECVFCKIVAGEMPSHKVYEDDKVIAFLDINPVNPGHTLVVSKNHYDNILDTPDDVLEHTIVVIKKITPAILKAVDSESCNIEINNGAVAGQIVMHNHWHVMPRFKDDGHRLLFEGESYEGSEAEKIAEKIKADL